MKQSFAEDRDDSSSNGDNDTKQTDIGGERDRGEGKDHQHKGHHHKEHKQDDDTRTDHGQGRCEKNEGTDIDRRKAGEKHRRHHRARHSSESESDNGSTKHRHGHRHGRRDDTSSTSHDRASDLDTPVEKATDSTLEKHTEKLPTQQLPETKFAKRNVGDSVDDAKMRYLARKYALKAAVSKDDD